jgi:hypothetical protein
VNEQISVEAVMIEKTYVGKVAFPLSMPERLVDWIRFPDDLVEHAAQMGLDQRAIKFLLALLRGKWSLTASVNLPDLAAKIGMPFSEMDEIIRSLIEKNYARLDDRLDLYRFWIVLLHLKGVRFVAE